MGPAQERSPDPASEGFRFSIYSGKVLSTSLSVTMKSLARKLFLLHSIVDSAFLDLDEYKARRSNEVN